MDVQQPLFGINRYGEHGMPASNNVGRFQFTGQAWLPEAGLYYFKARFYSASLGRFLQTDPIGYGGGMNLYAYVKGDPVNFTDPMGLNRNKPYEGIGGDIIAHVVSVAQRIYDDWGSPFVYSPGSGNAALFELPMPESVEPQSQQPIPQCVRSAGDGKFGFDDFVNFSAGLGDALLLGFGDELRDMMGIGSVDMNTDAYSAGAWASFAAGMGRAAYAMAAKGYSIFASSGAVASAGRESLKSIGRFGQAKEWRKFDPTGKTDAELRIGAGKTNKWINAYGAGVAAAGGFSANGCH